MHTANLGNNHQQAYSLFGLFNDRTKHTGQGDDKRSIDHQLFYELFDITVN